MNVRLNIRIIASTSAAESKDPSTCDKQKETWIIGHVEESDGVEVFCGGETHRHELTDGLVKPVVRSLPGDYDSQTNNQYMTSVKIQSQHSMTVQQHSVRAI